MSWYRRSAYGILALAVIVFGVLPLTVFSVVSSETGSRWLLQQAKPLLPTSVSIGELEGSLADQFVLHDVVFQSDSLSLEFSKVHLHWSPWSLLDGQLVIDSLQLGSGNIRVRSAQANSNEPSTDLTEVAIEVPLAIRLKQFQLAPSWLFINDMPEQQLSASMAAAVAESGSLHVSSLTLKHQYATTKVTLNASLQYPFQFSAKQRLELHSPDYPQTDVNVDAEGTIEQIDAAIQVQRSADVLTNIQLTNPLQSLQWRADMNIRQTTINPWLNAVSELSLPTTVIDGSLAAKGDSEQATLTPNLAISNTDDQVELSGQLSIHPQQIKLEALQADIAGRLKGQLAANGQIRLDTSPTLDIELTTEPLSFQETRFSGRHQLQGPLDKLAIASQGQLSTSEAPNLQLTSRALLTASAFNLNHILVEEVDGLGQLTGQASIDWQSGIRINANMDGRLMQSPVTVATQMKVEQPYVFIDQFNLQWRDSSLQASGSLAPGRKVTLTGDIQQLQKLPIPMVSLAGDMQFYGELSGTLNQPSAVLDIRSQRLQVNDRWLSKVRLKAEGNLEQQQLSISLTDDFGQLELAANNSLSDAQIRTDISELVITPVDMQAFTLTQPSELLYQRQSPSLSIQPLCLRQAKLTEPLCVSATTSGNQTQVKLAAPKVPLVPLNALLAGAGVALKGEASLQALALVDLNKQQLAEVDAEVNAKNVDVSGLEESFTVDTFRLTAKPAATQGDIQSTIVKLTATASDVGLNVNGQMTLDGFSPEATVKGAYQARLNDLKLLQVLMPNLSTAEGSLQASLAIDGQLQQPRLRPSLQADINKLLLTSTGTLVTNSQLSVERRDSQSDIFVLQGNGTIGDGEFRVSGGYDYGSQQLQATFNGQALQLLDTPRLAVRVSPHLNITLAQRDLSVTGSVDVPYARITPPELNNTVQPSADVVIKQNQQQQKAIQTSANIRLTLGNDVRVTAFGFEGRVDGALTLIQQPDSLTRANGQINVASGNYEIYGQELTINKGQLIYNGGPIDNPGLNLQVVRPIPEAPNAPERIGAQVTGTLIEPQLNLFSTPPMPDAHILSYLLFGRAPNSSSESSNLELQAALLVSGDVTQAFTQNLKDTFGFDEVMIDSSTNDVNDTSLYIGKYLSPNLYIKYGIGLIESTSSFFLRYQLSDHLWLESTSSTESQGGDLIYSVEK